MHTESCPCCGVPFTVHRNWPFVDDIGDLFCSLDCQMDAGIEIGFNDNEDLFSQMFNNAFLEV